MIRALAAWWHRRHELSESRGYVTMRGVAPYRVTRGDYTDTDPVLEDF